jgi:hypothetical protein
MITPMWMASYERVARPLSLLDHVVSLKGLLPPFVLGLMMDLVLLDGLPPCPGPAWRSGWLMLLKGVTLMEKHLYSPTRRKSWNNGHVPVKNGPCL